MDEPAPVGALPVHWRQEVPCRSLSYNGERSKVHQPDNGTRPEEQLLGNLPQPVAREPAPARSYDGSRRDNGQPAGLRPIQPCNRRSGHTRQDRRDCLCRQPEGQAGRHAAHADRPLGTASGMDGRLGQPRRCTQARVTPLRSVPEQPDFAVPHTRTRCCRSHVARTQGRPFDRMEHGLESLPVVATARRQPRMEADRRPVDTRQEREEKRRHLPQPLRRTPAVPD